MLGDANLECDWERDLRGCFGVQFEKVGLGRTLREVFGGRTWEGGWGRGEVGPGMHGVRGMHSVAARVGGWVEFVQNPKFMQLLSVERV